MLDRTRHVAAAFTQHQFDEYARLSGDDNPIHVDPGFAAGTRFGRTVAHGMLLFGALQAALARELNWRGSLQRQEFVFTAPTYTGDPLLLTFAPGPTGRIAESITDGRGQTTLTGTAFPGEPDPTPVPPVELVVSPGYKGFEVGVTASRSRTFTAGNVTDYIGLVNNPDPRYRGDRPLLPPGLLAGMDSWVLGVDLPGRGTNWLKHVFVFHRAVAVPAELTTTATVTRIRPEKGLINLATRTVGPTGPVASGEALVLAVDVPG